MDSLEERIEKIEDRNRAVENDKAWETSFARRILIVLFTYVAVVAFFYVIDLANPWVNALVPVLAFIVSTLTMPLFKAVWIRHFRKK